MKKVLLLAIGLLAFNFVSKAQDITKGLWYNDAKTSKIQFYETNGKVFGKIVWLKEPNNTKGKPKTDDKNPKEELRNTPLLNFIFMKNFKKVNDKKWEDGTIYDPTNGKTYSCIITQTAPNLLDVRGYVGISLLGRTSKFTRVD
jgi:uncharacterized protein (DUF2147 family)